MIDEYDLELFRARMHMHAAHISNVHHLIVKLNHVNVIFIKKR